MKKEIIISISRALLIILWIYAAGTKLLDYHTFLFSLHRQPLPSWSISFISIAIPVLEITAVVLLSIERLRNYGFLLSLILMISFTLYVGLALTGAFGEIPCSCGGIISKLKWKGHLVFNLIYTFLAWIGWSLHRNKINNKNTIQSTNRNNQLV